MGHLDREGDEQHHPRQHGGVEQVLSQAAVQLLSEQHRHGTAEGAQPQGGMGRQAHGQQQGRQQGGTVVQRTRITSYNVCYTKLLRASLQWPLQALLLFLLFSALVAWRAHWPQAARVATLAGANAALTLACWMFFAETSLTVALAIQLALLARLARDQGDLVPRWLIKLLAMAVILRLSANPWLLSYPLQGLFGLHWSLYGYGIPVLACALAARWLPEQTGDNTLV